MFFVSFTKVRSLVALLVLLFASFSPSNVHSRLHPEVENYSDNNIEVGTENEQAPALLMDDATIYNIMHGIEDDSVETNGQPDPFHNHRELTFRTCPGPSDCTHWLTNLPGNYMNGQLLGFGICETLCIASNFRQDRLATLFGWKCGSNCPDEV